MLHQNGPVDYKIWGVMQQYVYGTKICDIYDVQKCLTQTWVDLEQNVIEAAIDQWRDSLRSCMRAGGGHLEHILRNYCLFVVCDSSVHFMKLSMEFGACLTAILYLMLKAEFVFTCIFGVSTLTR